MTTRDRTVVMVLAAAAILALVWFALVGPRHGEYNDATAELDQATAALATAESAVAQAQVARRSYSSNYAQIARLGKAVPVDDEVPSLVYQLSSAADRHDIDFRSIKVEGASAAAAPQASGAATNVAAATLPPGAAIGAAGFPTMPFSFEFQGSFFDMSSFLRQLDGFATVRRDTLRVKGRLLTINGIAITAGSQGFPKVKASINATAFLLPADQGLTNGATASAPGTTSVAQADDASTPTPAATASVR